MNIQTEKIKEEFRNKTEEEQINQIFDGLSINQLIGNTNQVAPESFNNNCQDLSRHQTVLDYKVIRNSQIMRQSTIFTESNVKEILELVDKSLQKSILSFSNKDHDYLLSSPLKHISLSYFESNISQFAKDLTSLNNLLINAVKPDLKSSIGPFSSLDHLIEHTFHYNRLLENIMQIKQTQFKDQISQWRKVSGDGNCYYRAVIFSFLEQMILQNNQQLLINLIFDIKVSFEDNYLLTKINIKQSLTLKPFLIIRILIVIYRYLNQNNIGKAYEIYYKCMVSCEHFDYGLILYFRYLLYRYIKENETKLYTKEFPVLLGNLLPIEYETKEGLFLFKDFYDNYLLKMFQDAEKIVIYLTPFALCCNLNVYLFDLNQNALKEFKFYGKGNPNAEYTINILNNKIHYELIYSFEEYTKYQGIFNNYQMTNSYQNKVLNVKKEPKQCNKDTCNLNSNENLNFFLFNQDNSISKHQPIINEAYNKNSINKDQSLRQNNQIEQLNINNNQIGLSYNPNPYINNNLKPVSNLLLSQECQNFVQCSKCNNKYIGYFKLKICQKCVLNEIKSNYLSLYLMLISLNKCSFREQRNNNGVKEVYQHLFKDQISIQNITMHIEEALAYINYHQKAKSKHITFSTIINECKYNTCVNCEQSIQNNQLLLAIPCGCKFCSPKCQRSFLDQYPFLFQKYPLQQEIVCVCAQYYDLTMLYQLLLIVWNSSLPYYSKELSSFLLNQMNHYCMICLQKPKKEDLICLQCDNFSYEFNALFGKQGLYHSVCKLCFTNQTKSFYCSLCNIEHNVLAQWYNS